MAWVCWVAKRCNPTYAANQLGYSGALTVGSLEDEIRFYQKRTVDDCLELGMRLIILKELAPHGEFQQRIELLGIGCRMAQKFMSATLKCSKANSNSLLKSVGTQTKLLELLVFDDDELAALDNGESIRGINLDAIEKMSVSELKKALRKSNEQLEAKALVIENKSKELDQKNERLALLEHKKRTATVDETTAAARTAMQSVAVSIKNDIITELRKAVKALLEDTPGQHTQFAASCLIEISRELTELRDEYALPSVISDTAALDATWAAINAQDAQADAG